MSRPSQADPQHDPRTAAGGANKDRDEIARFDETGDWWDPDGPMRPLHDLNPGRLEWIEQCLGDLGGKRIVDVGCGGGLLTEALARRGAEVLGIDAAKQALQTAKLHAMESGIENLAYRHCTVEELAAEHPGEFDAVTCMEMLEHVPDPASVVRACVTLVRPGGDVCLSTLNRTPAAYLLGICAAEYVLRLLPRGTHRHDRFIRPSELAAWGREAGAEVERLTGMGYNPFLRKTWFTGDVSVNYLAHLHKA